MGSRLVLIFFITLIVMKYSDPEVATVCRAAAADEVDWYVPSDAIAQPDCLVAYDARGDLRTRCYQSYEEDAAHGILSRFAEMDNHYNFSALGWSNTTHPCKFPHWHGVGCEERIVDHGVGNYFEVSLTSWNMEQFCTNFILNGPNKLVGEIPVEFGSLTNLRTMIVRDCSMLYGAVPAALIGLPWLKELDLSRNNLNGSMQGILDLNSPVHEIEQINFSENRLFGELPLPNSTMNTLKSLDLSQNAFSTLSPDWCSNVLSLNSNLNYLNLSNNNLTGSFCLDNVRSIEKVDISNNQFDSIHSSNLSNINQTEVAIKFIWAKNNNISTFPAEVLQWPNLQDINLDNNKISGILALPYVYTATSNLATVSLVNNNISELTWKSEEATSLLDERHLRNLELILLLGENPICMAPAKNDEMKDLLRIVCRIDKSSPIPDPYRKGSRLSKTLIIVIACSCAFTVIVLCNALAFLAKKLKEQTKHLQELLKELNKREINPMLYASSELKTATGDFSEDNKLGEGAFGIVYKGVLSDGTSVAIKRLKKNSETMIGDFLNEIVVISSISHRNLVQLKGCCITKHERILIYELVDNMNLAEALWDGVEGSLDWEARFNIIVGIAEGLAYLHKMACRTIIHRDIKPSNILLDENLNPKIADFGIALLYLKDLDDETHQSVTTIAGTRGYLPYEYANLGQVSPKLDVFSYGVLLLEIVSGRKCIDCTLPIPQNCLYDWAHRLNDKGQLLELVDSTILSDVNLNLEVVKRVLVVGLQCTEYLPTSRPTMPDALDMLLGKSTSFDQELSARFGSTSSCSLDPIVENPSDGTV